MPFKYRFFFLLAFLAVFTKVQYFNDQHKLKGGFTLLENKLVLGSARGEPAKTPSLRIGLTMACSCRYFRWVELRRIIKISGFPNCLWWRTCSSSCFRPSPVLAACLLKYHKLFQKNLKLIANVSVYRAQTWRYELDVSTRSPSSAW